jgi:hypothetical protein
LRKPKRGLGRAYIDAILFIRGEYVLMGDADCTYDFRELGPFLESFHGESKSGSRFRGYIEPGSMPPLQIDSKTLTLGEWINAKIAEEPYWFHRSGLPGGILTPGWSNPRVDKLPHYGPPADMTGMRVLDIGNAEGVFSFEVGRRGAADVTGIENYQPMARKFVICRAALGASARTYMVNVYDLNPSSFGTFDIVMFLGVLYHLRHPIQPCRRSTRCAPAPSL